MEILFLFSLENHSLGACNNLLFPLCLIGSLPGKQRWQISVRTNVDCEGNANVARTIGTTGVANTTSTIATNASPWAIDKRNKCTDWSSGVYAAFENILQHFQNSFFIPNDWIGTHSTVAATEQRIIGTFGLIGRIQREWTNWPNISQHWIGTTGNIFRTNRFTGKSRFSFIVFFELMQCSYVIFLFLPKMICNHSGMFVEPKQYFSVHENNMCVPVL